MSDTISTQDSDNPIGPDGLSESEYQEKHEHEATLRKAIVLKSIASNASSEKSELLERIKAVRWMESITFSNSHYETKRLK